MAKITFQHNIKISSNKVQRDESLPAKEYEIFGKNKKKIYECSVLFYQNMLAWTNQNVHDQMANRINYDVLFFDNPL